MSNAAPCWTISKQCKDNTAFKNDFCIRGTSTTHGQQAVKECFVPILRLTLCTQDVFPCSYKHISAM
ncbi:hypothetical protein XELAEV_18008254mg [Xenopus laevis]|uniref:Uncharacterized protein n=1 Tax=Xenopus laevis TaxID=8355 RepID=A0A974E2A2_XENLA|nr:hypothetical protein XELAEV_18008254mg [Xenopus laevis]